MKAEIQNEIYELKAQLSLLLSNSTVIERKIEALEEELNAQNKWEPKGGEWFINYCGRTSTGSSTPDCAQFGFEREIPKNK
jgi:hypothetical protein